MQRWRLLLTLLGVGWAVPAAAAAPTPEPPFARAHWLEDYAFLKRQLEQRHSNLAWFASPEGGLNLPALNRRTLAALSAAQSDREARQAIRSFVAVIGDGHFSELAFLEPSVAPATPEPPSVKLGLLDPSAGCAALGYAEKSPVAFSLPFESLPGFRLMADGVATNFRVGNLLIDGRMIGIIRLKNFGRTQFPNACLKAWNTAPPDLARDGSAFFRLVTIEWLSELCAWLRRFSNEGAAAILVDVGNNSGGDESADWAARLFTDRPVRSARLWMTAGPLTDQYLDEQAAALKEVESRATGTVAAEWVVRARAVLAQRRRQAAGRACDLHWVWKERRRWNPPGCSRLAEVGWASGPFWPRDQVERGDAIVRERLYWPAIAAPFEGAWTGPTYVLTDGKSYSAAEMFTAVMRDNGIAKTMGLRTGGDGCGFMVDGPPTVLPHSKLRFRIGNCVRLRMDGSDEVAGIQPDIPVPPVENESARARAMRLLRMLQQDLSSSR